MPLVVEQCHFIVIDSLATFGLFQRDEYGSFGGHVVADVSSGVDVLKLNGEVFARVNVNATVDDVTSRARSASRHR